MLGIDLDPVEGQPFALGVGATGFEQLWRQVACGDPRTVFATRASVMGVGNAILRPPARAMAAGQAAASRGRGRRAIRPPHAAGCRAL